MQFKDIEGFEDKYWITDTGEVISKKTGNQRKLLDDYDGYLRVNLSANKRFGVHILVAKAFIPNPDNLTEVDHIDNDRHNNNVNNLRWVSRLENAKKRGPIKNNRIHPFIQQIEIESGEVIAEFKTFVEAAKALGRGKAAVNHISNCCNGKQKKYLGYRWRYKPDE